MFIAPMIAITAAIHYGLTSAQKAEAWRTSHLHVLHLIAGVFILALGVGMIASLWLGYV